MKVLIISIFVFSSLFSKDLVKWSMIDSPPIVIKDGQYKDQGIVDVILKEVISKTPNYRHSIKPASFVKTFESMKKYPLICLPIIIRTSKRDEFIHFSKALTVGVGNVLIVKKSSIHKIKPFIDIKGTVDLEKLLANGNFTLGLAKAREYGRKIDLILKDYKNTKLIYYRSGNDLVEGLLLMLASGRDIDGTISLPIEVNYLSQTRSIIYNDILEYIPISGATEVVFGKLACSKEAKSEKLIRQIDENIMDIRKVAYSIEKRWNTPKMLEITKPYWRKLLKSNRDFD